MRNSLRKPKNENQQRVSKTDNMHLIQLIYLSWCFFNYTFRPVIGLSSWWQFCYKVTVWSDMSDYSTILKLIRLLV